MSDSTPKKYKRGDLVVQTSGGPEMAVLGSANQAGEYECSWFDKHARRRRDWFHADLLMLAPRDGDWLQRAIEHISEPPKEHPAE